MEKHFFIFEPGIWIGEGKVTFTASPEKLHFFTKWVVEEFDASKGIICHQWVEIQGINENMLNYLTFYNIKSDSFSLMLENNLVGKVPGTGLLEKNKIAWEFRGHPEIEGFEVYELLDEGNSREERDYKLHAEYASTEHYRTIIDGRIWKKLE